MDNLLEQAAESPRLRMNYDLRNSADDLSQRMLNAMLLGMVLPIHRHTKTTETLGKEDMIDCVEADLVKQETYLIGNEIAQGTIRL